MPIVIYRTRKNTSKEYFIVYSEYKYGTHKVSLELHERVE